ncbi:MAG: hypothetical protein AVDCRST_MAG75-1749 [uncultured Propionibacteriaceae bacterium]|uniref:Aminoglycoside phosphotransferase domain-containing protein n=1 Tax=uncultured Propionibacteriaceae bacterium TaxID=257457 RepID=A0A6J4NQR4_9ACTN|nr:MAG: hypothetical protein AVDCRST_MAG75-1749 [uncultured Propionibacteriaceae bacterium]
MNFIDQVLHDHYEEFGLVAYGLKRRWATVLLTPRFVTSRHIVALVFPRGSRSPALVVKVPRQPGDNEGVERESDMLRQLALLTGGRDIGVPKAVGTVSIESHTVLVETALTGVALDPGRVAADLDGAIEVGNRFLDQLPVTRAGEDNQGWYDRTITAPLEALATLVPSQELNELIETTHQLLAPLRSWSAPAVFEHADFSHPNLLVRSSGSLEVVDWERASADGLPGHDLVFFLQYLSESASHSYSRERQVTAFDDGFGPKGWASPILRRHLEQREVEGGWLPLLVCATWARSAATLAYRLAPMAHSQLESGTAELLKAVTGDRDYWLWRHTVATAARS